MDLLTLSRLAKFLELTEYRVGAMIGMPGSVLGRRQKDGSLSPDESDRLASLAHVIDTIVQKFAGDEDEARRWLTTPNHSIKGEKPFDHLQTEIGRRVVEQALTDFRVVANQDDSLKQHAPGIFLSHNWNDKPFVRRLAVDITNLGARVWLDEAQINIGDSLIEAIRAGIDDMDYVAVVLSPNSIQSAWVQREVDVAMNHEIEGKRVKVLPLLLQKCEIPGFLKGKLYADFTTEDRYEQGLKMIAKKLGLLPDVKPPPTSTATGRKRRAG